MNDLAKTTRDVASAMTVVPFDLSSAMNGSAWRRDFRWPVAHMTLRERQMATVAAILEVVAGIVDPATRRLALLLQGPIGNHIRMIGELALLAEGASRSGLRFEGAPADFQYLSGWIPQPAINPAALSHKRNHSINLAFGRRLARVASWTRSPVRLAKAMIAPDHVAVSHNALMRDVAARSGDAVSFEHAEQILQRGRKLASPRQGDERMREVLKHYESVLGRTYPVAPDMLTRMLTMFRQSAPAVAERAARDLDGLSRLKRLPSSVWAGSGGPHAVRAIAIEVRRRGGATAGFDHGGSLSMMQDPCSIALRELSVCDRYVLPTHGCIEALARSGAVATGRAFGDTRLVAGPGDPTFRVPASRTGNESRRRPRIYYIVTIFRALRQLVPTLLPDPVYLDWQYRLVEAVRRLGVDLVCKPHPEGILRGGRHPLEDVSPVEYRKFEEIIDDADGFLYDYSQSTTFWEAVCTDRPITLIDFGITQFNATVAPLIDRRCRVIKARWDDRNLPIIDSDELADALLRRQSSDPSEFRQLLTGSA
jgi:hypothetical protein